MSKAMLMAVALLVFAFGLVGADDKPFVDHSFKCPVTTEFAPCAVVCVANITDCPTEMVCASGSPCNDGNCYDTDEECAAALEENGDLCEESCGIACPMTYSNFQSECETMFADAYAAAVDGFCEEDAPGYISYGKPGFVFCYVWGGVVTVLSLGWCCFNQRIFPRGKPCVFVQEVGESGVAETDMSRADTDTDKDSKTLLRSAGAVLITQTGYKKNHIGLFIYALVISTTIGLQILMAILCTMYYYVEYELTNNSDMLVFANDDTQALEAFEIAWHIGLVWCLLFKWPVSIITLFRRRCPLEEADCVLVFEERTMIQVSNSLALDRMRNTVDMLALIVNKICGFIFSDVTRPNVPGITTTCPVFTQPDGSRYIIYKFRKFNFNTSNNRFEPPRPRLSNVTLRQLSTMQEGLSSAEADTRTLEDGLNTLSIPKPTVFGVLFEEFSKPFYLYQNFMAWTWFNFYYWHMGIVNTIVYVSGGLSICSVNYRNRNMIHSLAKVEGTCEVLRDKQRKTISTTELVAGDVLVVKPGNVTCDFVLVKGELLLDESSLTGESMPVAKQAVEPFDTVYNASSHKKSTVFAGTTILASDDDSDNETKLGVVVRTGSNSSKGTHLRKILLGAVPQFKFDIEVKVVVLILLAYAVFGFGITLKFLDTDRISGWFYAMYVVGTALPPLLPTVFVVSVGIGSARLREKDVVCSDPNRILMAGKVRVACFDKTGTLTKAGLDFHGLVKVRPGQGSDRVFGELEPKPDTNASLVSQAMATCHSLTKVGSRHIGNSVDVMMFETSGWTLDHSGKDHQVTFGNTTIQITRRHDFDHRLAVMSVFARHVTDNLLYVFAKGSAESIKARCVPESVPENFDSVAEGYSRAGCYVLALAGRRATEEETAIIQSQEQISREGVERDLELYGLILFKNELKPDTASALQLLREGNVRTLVISGDHPLTTIHIARQSGIIPQGRPLIWAKAVSDGGQVQWLTDKDEPTDLPTLDSLEAEHIEIAVTGEVFRSLQLSESFLTLLPHIRVFARMTPDDKIAVVQHYISRGFITMMCGDGGNDCGALRVAHVGVALSDAEASVVSPFTALSKSCMATVDVLLEGRACLASSFSSYRYMIMYGQVETINQIVNAWYAITFYEWCWVFMDGIWLVGMAFTLPFAFRAKKLSDARPPSSVLGAFTMSSVLGVLAINFIFLCIGLAALNDTEWYSCRKWKADSIANPTLIGDNYESSVIFLVSGAQYITSAMAFNFGFKHRAPWLFNWRFVLLCIAYLTVHFVVIMVPSGLSCLFRVNCEAGDIVRGATTEDKVPIQNPLNTTLMPVEFRRILILIICCNCVAVMAWEYFVVNGPIGLWIRSKFRRTTPLNL